jgi:hypothetical protein
MPHSSQRGHTFDEKGRQASLCLDRHRLAAGDVRIDRRLAQSQGAGERRKRDRVYGDQLAE